MPGDGDGHGDGDGDGDRDESSGLLTMPKKRLVRLDAGVDSTGCWGICSPEDCCALARFGAEAEAEVVDACPERFHFQGAMLKFYIAAVFVYSG